MRICRSENVPDELKPLKQWVCWKAEDDAARPGKIRKIPINPATGGQAMSNNPETWAGFQTALAASDNFSGVGFMFAGGYFGVDIDGCEGAIEDFKNGETENIVAEFVHGLQSYSEWSVSGKGLHVICRGSLPPGGRRKKNVEMYESGRFFIVTGDRAAGYPISDCTEKIKPLHEKYIGGAEPVLRAASADPPELSDSEVVRLASASKQGKTFSDLFAGNWEPYFSSQSEADMSLCSMLAFWTRRDEAAMDRIFRSSGLMREKWNRANYGKTTIAKAARTVGEVYSPREQYSISIGKTETPVKPRLFPFDDTGNARRMEALWGQVIRYSYVNKSWFWWDGRRWAADDTGAVKRMADQTVDAMKAERDAFAEAAEDKEEAGKAFDKFHKSCRSSKSKTAMLKETEHLVPVKPDQFDRHPHLLNAPNGVLNLKTGELAPHDITRYLTKIAHAEYTDHADAPQWERFLQDIFSGDADVIRFMQKAVGYSLTGSTREDCMFFCYGTGRNGKSTFLNTIAEIMGDYAINVQPETVMVRNAYGGPSSDVARLAGARFVTVPEPSDGARLNEGLVKQMTGGDVMTASRKYENEFEFKPEFKLWMPTNYKPKIYGTDVGIWARIRMIPFTVRIPDEKMDKNLRLKLKQESAGIMKWAVDGCLLWQREGLEPPRAVREATAEYKSEMDVLAAFLDECCEAGNYDVLAGELYQAYAEWCERNGERAFTSTKFGYKLTERFKKSHTRAGWAYSGIRLNRAAAPYAIRFG